MGSMENRRMLDLLKGEMVKAMGCTEPAAGALCGAAASSLLKGSIESVKVSASRDMVKNAMGVGLPNCTLKGIGAAVALGIVKADASSGLTILSDLSNSDIERASLLSDKISLIIVENVPGVFVEVSIEAEGHMAKACVKSSHDNICYLELDGKVLLDERGTSSECIKAQDRADIDDLNLEGILEFAKTVDAEELGFIKSAIDTNLAIAHEALSSDWGLSVGRVASSSLGKEPQSLDEALGLAAATAAAGSDARMSGCTMAVVINSGSGNQGLTVTLPPFILGKYLKKTEDEICRAVCISELVGLLLTRKKDKLSALCGAFTASIGTACAYVYLMGGCLKAAERAINCMVGDLTGIICDGAKMTCAMKIWSCVQAAGLSARLALVGLGPGKESGIVGSDCSESLDYLSQLSHEGMEKTDQTILSIMLSKTQR